MITWALAEQFAIVVACVILASAGVIIAIAALRLFFYILGDMLDL